jgi:flagellar motor switch protein FliG
MDFYARNTFDINEEERLNLLRRLHHRCVAGKMAIHGSRSATLFDYLADMDAPQIMEMIRNESVTVKAIVLTQCDSKKRQILFHSFDEPNRMKLMAELTRIDNLPKNYIYNVASALRRKKAENPRLNTEALPGTDVLVTFLERSSLEVQKGVIQQLLNSSAETLQNVKSKLVSVDTLRFLKDSQLVEVISGMKHDELLVFLKGCNAETREAVLVKAPQDLSVELREELQLTGPVNKEAFSQVERKFMNRIKVLASQGHVNLAEVNERMFAYELGPNSGAAPEQQEVSQMSIRRVA